MGAIRRGMPPRLAEHRQVARHDDGAAGHRLDDRQAEPLAERRQQNEPRAPVQLGQDRTRLEGNLDDGILDPEPHSKRALTRRQRAAYANEAHGLPAAHSCHDVQQ